MRRSIEEQIQDRRIELELEELGGRAEAPDRLHEILARHNSDRATGTLHTWQPAAPSRTANLLAAALVVLAIGVTATIFGWNTTEQSPPKTASHARPAQDKQPPAPQGKSKPKAKAGKATDPAATKPTRPDPEPANPLTRSQLVREARLRADLEAERALRKQGEAQRDRAGTLGTLLGAGPAKADVKRSVRRIQAALTRARLARGGRVVQPGPMQQGEVGKVMARLQRDVQELTRSGSPEQARKRLDELQRTVDDARRAIWEMRKRAEKPAAKGDK